MLGAEFTDGWNVIVTGATGVLGAAVGGGATAWATTRAESRRLREARSARLYESRTAIYRSLAHQIGVYRAAVMDVQLARSPAPLPFTITSDQVSMAVRASAVGNPTSFLWDIVTIYWSSSHHTTNGWHPVDFFDPFWNPWPQ